MRFEVLSIAVLIWLQPIAGFAQECGKPHHKGAGVLPYSINQNGQIQLLLGYEQGRGWSSFGGGPKQVESLIEPVPRCETRQETALREGVEELRFLISRGELREKIKNARSFPETARLDEFITFVVLIEAIDLTPYYSTPVLSGSGYTETSAVGWIPLHDLAASARQESDMISTPNGEPLWPVFWNGLKRELVKDGAIEGLFPGMP